MPENADFVCPTCKQQTPAYFAAPARRGRRRVCLGCGLDRWIPAGYEDQERYKPACPVCGGLLVVLVGTVKGKEGEWQYECTRERNKVKCGLRWSESEIEHHNATRRPPLGAAWLDERHQTVEDALLMCPVGFTLR